MKQLIIFLLLLLCGQIQAETIIIDKQSDSVIVDKDTTVSNIEDILVSPIYGSEAKLRHQDFKFFRFNKNRELMLGFFLEIIGGLKNISSMDVYHSNGKFEKQISHLKDIDAVRSYNLREAITSSSESTNPLILEDNLILTINYSDKPSTVLFIRALAKSETSLYLRLSFMIGKSGIDDLKTLRSKSAPEMFSAVVAYDYNDSAEFLKDFEQRFNKILEDLNKGVVVGNIIDKEIVKGVTNTMSIGDSYQYGKFLYENKRYYDAIGVLRHTYVNAKETFWNMSADNQALVIDACRMLAYSYTCIGDWDMFRYYQYLVDHYDNTEYRLTYNINKSVPKILTFGYVLNRLLGVDKKQVIGMALQLSEFSNNKVLENTDNFWNMDVEELFIPNTTISLPYTQAYYETRDTIDKSILYTHNSIVIRINPIENMKDFVRITIMLPNFKANDYKRDSKDKKMIYNDISFIYKRTKSKSNISTKARVKYAEELIKESRWLESLHQWELLLNSPDINETQKMNYSFYVGYCLCDLGLYEAAAIYLDMATKSNDITVIMEYINALCNCNDIRALSVIDKYLSYFTNGHLQNKDMRFVSYLHRRKAYILIEQKRYDEAKELLNKLKEDPQNRNFAISELRYIEKITSR